MKGALRIMNTLHENTGILLNDRAAAKLTQVYVIILKLEITIHAHGGQPEIYPSRIGLTHQNR